MIRIIPLIFFLLSGPVLAAGAPALVFDPNTGAVLHEENAGALWFPASLTKLMTAYVAFNAVAAGRITMETPLSVTARAAAEPPSKIGMPVGSKIELGRALEILIVKSANDLAVVIAEGVSGSVEGFVGEMNATAARLGMVSTNFANPNGLPAPEQVTTARDLGLLATAIIRQYPQYGEMFSMPAVKIGKRSLRSHNSLLGKFEGADGMKTGFICASGFNLVASATRKGRRLVAIVLGADTSKSREERASALLQAAFQTNWWTTLLPRKLVQIAATGRTAARPLHMGPVVCKKRYPAGQDAYAIDARLQQVAEAKMQEKAAQEAGETGDAPLALTAAMDLPDAVKTLKKAPFAKGRPAPGTPLPPLRPAR